MAPLLCLLASGGPPPPVRAVEQHAERLRGLELRRDTLTRFVEETVDLEEVCARLLGPHRRNFSVEELREFSQLFVAILVARARQHGDVLNTFEDDCALERGSQVRCTLKHGDQSARAWFTLRGERVVDARVGDMTMIKENRTAIDRLIRTKGIPGLLERMRQRARPSSDPDERR